jgi:hypothetical protein
MSRRHRRGESRIINRRNTRSRWLRSSNFSEMRLVLFNLQRVLVLLSIRENNFNIMKNFLLLVTTHHIIFVVAHLMKVLYGFVICSHISWSFQFFEPIFLFIVFNNQHRSLVLDLLFQRWDLSRVYNLVTPCWLQGYDVISTGVSLSTEFLSVDTLNDAAQNPT